MMFSEVHSGGGEVHIALKGELAEIHRLADAIEDFGTRHSLPRRAVYNLVLVLDELLTNTITYGCPRGSEHRIDISLRLEGDAIEVTASDDATLFNPFDAPAPDLESPLDDRPIGGLGVHFLKSLTIDAVYRQKDGRNLLTFRVPRTPPEKRRQGETQ